MKKALPLHLIVPAGILAATLALTLLGLTGPLDDRIYDLFIRFIPAPKQDQSILLVQFDDPAINEIGTWPVGRDITADGLMLLREMGAEYALFDIEYVDKSPRGVNAEILSQDLPLKVRENFGDLDLKAGDLVAAIAKGQISAKDAKDYLGDLSALSASYRDGVLAELDRVARDNDAYLAQAAGFFGKAFFTVNMQLQPVSSVKDEARAYAVGRFSLKNLALKGGSAPKRAEIQPVISPIIERVAGLGFPNIVIDPDGVRRRVDLLIGYGDAYFAQLALAPVLDKLGNPALELRPGRLVLKGAKLPSGTVKDISVPLGADGRVLINWPHAKFVDSFRPLSYYFLYKHDQMYRELVNNIRIRDASGYYSGYAGETSFLELARQADQLKSDIMAGAAPPEAVADYRALRDRFVAESGAFLDSEPEKALMAQLEAVLADKRTPAADRQQYEQIKAELPGYFAKTRDLSVNLRKMREKIGAAAEGAFCIIGQANTGSTDMGVNPFQEGYANMGTHASVANMFFTDNFIADVHPLWSLLAAALLSYGLALLVPRLKPSASIAIGSGVSVLAVALAALFFVLTSRFLPVMPLILPLVLSFVSITFIKFLSTEREKGFLRNAFSHYLSNEVIKQIVADPGRLKLGGDKKTMTAIFTDIRGFSTISEKLLPEELVALLNQYLTAMSDIILELQGTIDKYEGDAIISFFGAPIAMEDHAERACLAAIRMKRAESILNQKFLTDGVAPSPLLTRIGINTGEMVVGNMGTEKKMDYTIIGDSVNLAARLEGVNKQYGSWILASEDTIVKAGPGIVSRKMDRIKVVGKNVPIRIFEVIEEKGKVSEKDQRLLDSFHAALDVFEAREWKAAQTAFQSVLKEFPDDGPSQRYLKLAAEYCASPPPANWDGIFALTLK